MERINVNTNRLRLLSRTFLFLQPVKQGKLCMGQKVHLVTDEYGEMGTVEVLQIFEKPNYDLSPMVRELTHGDKDCNEHMIAPFYPTDAVQVCTLRFVRRFDQQFTELIDRETRRAGITITRQGVLM